jgi:hypothetical protein
VGNSIFLKQPSTSLDSSPILKTCDQNSKFTQNKPGEKEQELCQSLSWVAHPSIFLTEMKVPADANMRLRIFFEALFSPSVKICIVSVHFHNQYIVIFMFLIFYVTYASSPSL